ncbi:MAG TPA: redoxin domain-containing protein [Candidatus Sumerlaeota bacterium]|nr:redoxin domain-containing protein [Candidatus Sumerlaeota bacterium]
MKFVRLFLLMIAIVAGACGVASAQSAPGAPAKVAAKAEGSLLEIPFTDAKGTTETLSMYKGQVMLVVNVASKCGYTPQYKELEELYEKYKDQGFVVVGFPSNDFNSQEPGTNEEIQMFCKGKYNVTFPVKGKMPTRNDDKSPLYKALTGPNSPYPGAIGWNFEKFIIDRRGNIVGRFKSKVTPMSPEITGAVEKALAGEK